MSVRPSAFSMEQLGSYWTDFCEIWYLRIFRKYIENIQVWLKSDKNKGYFIWKPTYIYDNTSLNSFYNETVSDKSCRKNQNTRFMFNNFFRKSYRLWGNVEKYFRARQATDDNTAQGFACWISKAVYTHSEYVILIVFHGNNGYVNAPQCCVVRTLPVL
jgi:hypothetical protein